MTEVFDSTFFPPVSVSKTLQPSKLSVQPTNPAESAPLMAPVIDSVSDSASTCQNSPTLAVAEKEGITIQLVYVVTDSGTVVY